MINPYHELILIGISKKKTYREIADDMGKAHGTVQYHLNTFLIPQGFVTREVNPATGRAKSRSLRLTDKGQRSLEKDGHNN